MIAIILGIVGIILGVYGVYVNILKRNDLLIYRTMAEYIMMEDFEGFDEYSKYFKDKIGFIDILELGRKVKNYSKTVKILKEQLKEK